MRKPHWCRLQVEGLEERWTPALLLQLDAGGNLTGIFGVPSGNVSLVLAATDTLSVTEGASSLGTYALAGNLNVSVGNNPNPLMGIGVLMNLAGFDISGSVRMSAGNGRFGVFIGGNGTIGGNVTLSKGVAPVATPGQVGVASGIPAGGNVTIQGNLTMTVGGNLDDIFIGGGGNTLSVGGNVVARGGNQFGVGSAGSTVGGNLSYTSGRADVVAGLLEAGSSVAGNVTFVLGAGNDSVDLNGTIGGSAFVNLANGNDTFGMAGTVLGRMSLYAAGGNDSMTFSGTLGDSLTVIGGSGNSNLIFNAGATVLGSSVYYSAGNGNDSLTVNALTAPGARLTAVMSNGNDSVTFDATASTVAAAYLDGGFGTDVFNSTGTISFPLTLRSFP